MDTKNQNEPEPTDVQARVLLDVTEDIPTFYVNYIEVSTSTPHDLYLICARIPGKLTRDQLLDAKESKEVFFQPEVQIVMTHALAEDLVKLLASQVQKTKKAQRK